MLIPITISTMDKRVDETYSRSKARISFIAPWLPCWFADSLQSFVCRLDEWTHEPLLFIV